MGECKYRDDGLNWIGLSEAEDFAAHRLHKTHVVWEHSALSGDPTGCYQCHAFARIIGRALAQFEQGAKTP